MLFYKMMNEIKGHLRSLFLKYLFHLKSYLIE